MTSSHISHAEPAARPADAVILGPDLPPHLAESRRLTEALWFPVSAELTEAIVPVADRDDVLVSAVTATVTGATANFIVPRATVEVDRAAFGAVDPATLRPSRPNDRYRYPAAFGALVHEAAHAAHSTWTPADVAGHTTPAVLEAAELLEEARIEAAQLTRRPTDRIWLRATVTTLVWPELNAAGITSRQAAAQAAALVLARVEAGVLEKDEVAPVREAAAAILGPDTLAALETIWRGVMSLTDGDAAGMLAAGEAWCRTVGTDESPKEKPDASGSERTKNPATGTPGDPTATPDPGRPSSAVDPTAGLTAAIGQTVERVTATVRAATADVAAAATAEAEAETRAEAQRREAAEVFATHHTGTGRRSDSPIAGTRVPTAAERGAASALAKALRAASARDRSAVTIATGLPPGRLRMRGALSRDAQRAAGAMPTAKPFTATVRRHTEQPSLRAGIAVDVSLSMQAVTGPMASAAWILARAVSATDPRSKTATVTFGNTVTAITRPGVNPAQVTEFRARCNTEEFGRALSALDMELGLSLPGAARLLVVVSDGEFRKDQAARGRTQLKALTGAGCAVLWLTLGRARAARDTGHVRFLTVADPATAAAEIGHAAVAALIATR